MPRSRSAARRAGGASVDPGGPARTAPAARVSGTASSDAGHDPHRWRLAVAPHGRHRSAWGGPGGGLDETARRLAGRPPGRLRAVAAGGDVPARPAGERRAGGLAAASVDPGPLPSALVLLGRPAVAAGWNGPQAASPGRSPPSEAR